jgi:glycosyltransferase involved in cell wall biosynthesis
MRHALPIIAADRGGPGHVVNRRSGILVPVEGPDQLASALADAIRELASSPQQALALSRGARKRAVELGSWPGKVEAMAAIYQSIVNNQEQPRKVQS